MGPKTGQWASGSIHGSAFPSLKRNSLQSPRRTACVAPWEKVTLKKAQKSSTNNLKKAQKNSKKLKNPQKTSKNLKKPQSQNPKMGRGLFGPVQPSALLATRSSQTTLTLKPHPLVSSARNPAEREITSALFGDNRGIAANFLGWICQSVAKAWLTEAKKS